MNETALHDSEMLTLIETLRPIAPRTPQAAFTGREAFLREARSLARHGRQAALRAQRSLQWVNLLSGALLGLMLLFAAGFTAVAASYSLPGDILYPLKEWGEKAHLALAVFPEDDLGLILEYTDRRLSEMARLALAGHEVPETLVEHMDQNLEQALWVALNLDDQRLAAILAQVEKNAEQQALVVYGILAARPDDRLLMQLAQRLGEQVLLAELGQADPQAFRQAVHTRQQAREQASEAGQGCNKRLAHSLLWVMTDTPDLPATDATIVEALMHALQEVAPRDEAAAQRGRERFLEEVRVLHQSIQAALNLSHKA